MACWNVIKKRKRKEEKRRNKTTRGLGLNECENELQYSSSFRRPLFNTQWEARVFCVFRRGDESEKMFFKYPQMRLSSHEII